MLTQKSRSLYHWREEDNLHLGFSESHEMMFHQKFLLLLHLKVHSQQWKGWTCNLWSEEQFEEHGEMLEGPLRIPCCKCKACLNSSKRIGPHGTCFILYMMVISTTIMHQKIRPFKHKNTGLGQLWSQNQKLLSVALTRYSNKLTVSRSYW